MLSFIRIGSVEVPSWKSFTRLEKNKQTKICGQTKENHLKPLSTIE